VFPILYFKYIFGVFFGMVRQWQHFYSQNDVQLALSPVPAVRLAQTKDVWSYLPGGSLGI
jgi:hypothetical protein